MARLWLVTALALILFVWLAREVTRGDALRLDTPVREAVHARSSPPLTAMMRSLSLIGSEVGLVPLGAILVWWLVAAKRRRAAVVLAVAALGAEALDQIMKLLFNRPRPEPFFGLAAPITHSFPSGHAMVSCCFFGVLAAILAARERSQILTFPWRFYSWLPWVLGSPRLLWRGFGPERFHPLNRTRSKTPSTSADWCPKATPGCSSARPTTCTPSSFLSSTWKQFFCCRLRWRLRDWARRPVPPCWCLY